jgi:hypothetical protein
MSEIESEGVFCPQCGSAMKQFGPKSRKQLDAWKILNTMQLMRELRHLYSNI